MAFDWFRRTFFKRSDKADNGDQPSDPTPETETVDSVSESDSEIEASAEQSDVQGEEENPFPETQVSDEVLAFAQATYENIQRQTVQSIAVEEPAAEPIPEEGMPVAQTVEGMASETIADVEASFASESGLAASLQVEPVESETAEPEPDNSALEILTPPNLAIAIDVEPHLDATTHSPIQSEPLSEIKATELISDEEQPEEIEGTGSGESPLTLPAFDEGFIWSAEVLAKQGRRAEDISVEEINWLQKLRKGLAKTRLNVVNRLKAIVGQGPLNQDGVTEIETLLLQADVGVEATDYIIEQLQQKLRSEVLPPDEAIAYLKELLCDMLNRVQTEQFMPRRGALNIWLMTGVNGAGKTTTIGKIAHVAQKSGYNCMIAAADTFRAAAVEQVRIWGQRSNVEVICNPGKNTDPAAVVFDGITAAQARGIDLLLVDTAGRLQNKKNLMDELSKIRRIVDKKAPDATVESLLVLDATLGQNGLRQAQVFSESAKLTGVVLTKLDGTAKGGVALGVVKQLGLPIRFVGAGEGIEDLRPFSSYEFVEALLSS